MDVDGFTAHTFTAFTQGLDLDAIVVIGREAELHTGFVGVDGVDVVEAMSFHQHLSQVRRGAKKNERMQTLW